MALTVDRVAQYVGADPERDLDLVEEVLTNATVMVEHYVGDSEVPEAIVDLAVVRVCNELWSQSAVSMPISQQFYETAEAPAATNRDPMTTAYVILRKWVLPW